MENKLKFTKFSSIENAYRTKEINTIIEQGKGGGEWCVMEKIHGANFSLWYNGADYKSAKRTAFLGNDGCGFFNSDEVKEKHESKVKAIWNVIAESWDNEQFKTEENPNGEFKDLVLFGEIFGGVYNHPDVERNVRATKVQKEVQYTPNNEFYCFDIKVNGTFLNHRKVETLCKFAGIFYAEMLFVGTLEECMNYKNDYNTTIPARLGFPEIEDNITEGNVIKPIESAYFWNGSRVILKNKNDKFKEKHDKGGKNKAPKVKEPIKFSEEAQKFADEIVLYVTENRLKNVLSKIGDINDKQFGLLMSAMNQDVMEDFLKDHKDGFIELDVKERKSIQKLAGSTAALLIRKHFLNIIDGEY